MDRREKRKWRKKILYMVVMPALIAACLLGIARIGARRAQEAEAGGTSNSRKAVEEQAENSRKTAPEQTNDGKDTAGGQTKTGGNTVSAGAETGTEASLVNSPIQQISFIAAGSRKEQRSLPVQIDAAILGGEDGALCWAVFLPAEMAGDPGIQYSGIDTVTLGSLQEREYLDGARPDPKSSTDSSEDKSRDKTSSDADSGPKGKGGSFRDQDPGRQVLSPGDRVHGMTNGSAFSVKMELADGSVQTEVLYVFSCTDTATMYLDTESGSMEKVDADETKESSEKADFIIFLPDGSTDSEGKCTVSGRGNSTWYMNKRPYNLNLSESKSVLGMQSCKKLCLLANTFDTTNLLDRVSSQLAIQLKMRDTPQGEFVNLFLNGKYNGLYYLSQRPRPGGSVQIDKLDNLILKANNRKDDSILPKKTALHEEGDSRKKWAYTWAAEPADNTGGYLLQQHNKYNGDDCWFSTVNRRFRITSPAYPTVGEVNYIADYMEAAEDAIYDDKGIDLASGKHYSDFLDLPSWEDMFLLEELFVEWDGERFSFFITKDRGDPLLYCGPMWDFDHSAGLTLYGDIPETTVTTLMFRDSRYGWMHKLLSHEEFVTELYARWRERFSPAVHTYLDTELEKEIAAIESSAYMNNIRRANDVDYKEETAELTEWLQRRTAFLDDYTKETNGKNAEAGNDAKSAGDADDAKDTGTDNNADTDTDTAAAGNGYCRVMFHFPWGDISHYVRRGESLGYLPLPEYGETQVPSQIEKNEIIGWLDEDGNEIGADIVIDRNRAFSPVIRQESR